MVAALLWIAADPAEVVSHVDGELLPKPLLVLPVGDALQEPPRWLDA